MADMKRVLEAAAGMQLAQDDQDHLDSFMDQVVAKHPKIDASALSEVLTNTSRYYKAIGEAGAGSVAADTDAFRDISMIVTTKFFAGSTINELASVQPLNNVYGYIYRLTFEYADTHAPSGVVAGNSLSAVRSGTYATDPGEQVVARRLKAELRQELVEAALRPIQLSSTFQSMLKRASVFGKGNEAAFDNRFLQAAYSKLRDELEVVTIGRINTGVPAGHVATYTAPAGTDPQTEKDQAYGLFFDAAADASTRVFNKTGYYPNVMMVGQAALQHIERWIKVPNQGITEGFVGIPQRGKLGVFGKRWMVYYDPSITDYAIVGAFNPDDPMFNPIIYAPYISIAVSPEILDKDLTTTQIAFSVDRIDLPDLNLFGRVDLT